MSEPYRPLDEAIERLRGIFSDDEIDRLLRQATIRQADGASADRAYMLERVRELSESDWEAAQPIVAELLRVLAHLVASVETLWAALARIEQRVEQLEGWDEP